LPNQNTISSRRRNETAFANLPEAISNISEIVDKIEIFDLARVLLPKFEIQLNLIILKTQLMAEYEVKMRI
jgi:DNA polymerase-3 subunit alpha